MIKLNSMLLSFLLFVSIFAVFELGIVVRDLRQTIQEATQATAETKEIIKEVHTYTSVQIKNLESQQRAINASIQAAAVFNATGRLLNTSVIPRVNKTLDSLNESVLSVNTMVKNTDKNINVDLLPQITETAKSFNISIESLNLAIISITKNSDLTFAQINDTMASAEWKTVLKEVASTTEHIDNIAGNIEKTTDRMPAMAELIEKMMRTTSKYQKAVILSQIISAVIRAF
jgi:hypothetical protein